MPIQSDLCKSIVAKYLAYKDLSQIFYSYGDGYWGHYYAVLSGDYLDLYAYEC
jgi:hypothetical protein